MKRIYKPSRTDVAVLLLIVMACFIGLLFWHIVHDQYWKAFIDFIGIVAIRTFPWGLHSRKRR